MPSCLGLGFKARAAFFLFLFSPDRTRPSLEVIVKDISNQQTKCCFEVWKPDFVNELEELIRDRKLHVRSPEERHTEVHGNGLMASVLCCLMQAGNRIHSSLWPPCCGYFLLNSKEIKAFICIFGSRILTGVK